MTAAGRAAVVAGLLLGIAVPPAPVALAEGCAAAQEQVVGEESWAQRRLAPSRVWALAEGAVPVAVVDTGVSATAPALAGAVTPTPDLGGGPADVDCSGHGTFLAGLIAARPRDGVPFAGVAPAARLLPVRVTDNPAEVDPVRLGAGIRAAVDAGARVVAVGLVTPLDRPELRAAVAAAAEKDVVVVASAAVRESGTRAYPAALPGVVAVAPLGVGGPPPNTPLGAEPAVAAPAEALVGIAPSGAGHREASAPELAVAYVAGAAALVRDRHPGLRAPAVVARLLATADRPAGPSPHPRVGHGVVDPVAAVTTVFAPSGPVREPVAERLDVPRPPEPDTAPARRALWFAAVVLGAALVLGGGAGLVALGRRGRGSPTPAPGDAR
ncbi:S8 family serine peptidase [Saccharothrix sp. BKS2]|uniref:S8 family serine peptidase n=1 Tax=Saccharothrix sp. BKS2 TaxID=3064400 RepID=UPI0039E8CA5E